MDDISHLKHNSNNLNQGGEIYGQPRRDDGQPRKHFRKPREESMWHSPLKRGYMQPMKIK